MWKVREIADKVTNVVMNYTEIESKVREATNDEAWGPHGSIKQELSQATYSYDQFPEVMGMLWKRIAENKRSPRRMYKSLILLHHLLLHGSDRVVRTAQDRLYEIRALQDYHVVYEPGFNLDAIIPPSGTETKDGELNVRVKAKELVDLVGDEEKLREERKKARKNRDKYVGIGSDRMTTTSKWDNGDYSGSASGSYGYDDEYEKKSRSRSPSPSYGKAKPYSDNDSSPFDFKNSSSSNSFNNNRSFKSKPAPPSPSFEVSDDFDPRADEKVTNDFGDFASANATAAAAATITSKPVTAKTSGDFADFQSAFGDSNPEPASAKGEDLLGISLDLGGPASISSSTNNASLLTEDLFSSGVTMPSLPQQRPTSIGFPAFGAPAAVAPSSVPPPMASPLGMGQMSPGFGMGQSSPVMNFGGGGSNVTTPVLQPARTDGSTNNGNNGVNNNNNSKVTLQGTTWSDLNISMDDLNLGRSNSKQSTNKTPMNQLKSNVQLQGPPTTTNDFGGLL